MAKRHTTVSVERATLRLAGLSGADPDGTPWVNRLLDTVRADVGLEHGVVAAGLGRAGPRRGRRPDRAGAEGGGRARSRFRLPDGPRRRPGPGSAARKAVGAGIRPHRRPPARARAAGQALGRPAAAAVDLPDRRHRRHLRGHPAGAGGRPRGRRRHRGDPLDRPVAARLRARGRHPRGVRRHVRHPGELPADAGRARRVEQGARPLRAADQLRVRAVHARDRRRWPGSSAST